MNWNEIKEKYPKAFGMLCENEGKLPEVHKGRLSFFGHNDNYVYNNRDLFDFFDKNEIYIEIGFEVGTFNSHGINLYVDIYNDKMEDLNALDERFYKDRKEAENEAFSKAFELLENKLING